MEKAFGVQRRSKVMEVPKGMKMIAKDFDQELIATRIKEDIGKELDEVISSQLEDIKDKIEIDGSDEEITIRLMGESTFDSGKAVIRPQMKPLLKKVAELIQGNANDIIIAGHTDNVPILSGPYRTNLRLSTARASAVAEYIISHSKINPQRISTMGFGEYRPIDTNETSEGRQKNRRVEIILSNLPNPSQVREF
jgi:chemotaxis protein MotB